jgi:hypothetical protein
MGVGRTENQYTNDNEEQVSPVKIGLISRNNITIAPLPASSAVQTVKIEQPSVLTPFIF